ncbi:MAG: hypothetical protein AB1492_03445 [Bacillota bacterium]
MSLRPGRSAVLDFSEGHALPRLRLTEIECDLLPAAATLDSLAGERGGRLPPGGYGCEVPSFCLEAGKHAPGEGTVYALATLRGRLSGPVGRLLRGAAADTSVAQEQVQSLVWAITSGTGYHGWSSDLRRTAERLLSERDLVALGKNYWRLVPGPVRELVTGELQALAERVALLGDIRAQAARLSRLIAGAQTTYAELERAFVRLGPPPGQPEQRFSAEDWSLVPGGCFARVSSNSYRSVRMQIYVPAPVSTSVERDRLGRVTRILVDELEVTLAYDDSAVGGLALPGGDTLDVWPLSRVALRDASPSGGEEISVEAPEVAWSARDPGQLAALDLVRHPQLAERIESARTLTREQSQLSRLSGVMGAPATSSGSRTPLDDIIELQHYRNGLEAVFADFKHLPSHREKAKWLAEHFRRLTRAYAYLASLLCPLPGGSSGGSRDTGGAYFRPQGLIGLPDDSRKQALGLRL